VCGRLAGRSGAERLNPGVQSRLVAGGLILVNDAFDGHSVDHGYGLGQRLAGSRLVATGNRRFYPLQVGSKH